MCLELFLGTKKRHGGRQVVNPWARGSSNGLAASSNAYVAPLKKKVVKQYCLEMANESRTLYVTVRKRNKHILVVYVDSGWSVFRSGLQYVTSNFVPGQAVIEDKSSY
ncbi:hypothetical protein BsWGS_22004 [Bradybaena similaris]